MNLDFRKQRSEKFLAEHILNSDDLKKLIEGKIKRAKAASEALQKREQQVKLLD